MSANNDTPYTDYERWVRRLYQTNLFHPVKLGLENTHRLYDALGKPLEDIPVIHIAGTNGKGSVALKTAKVLEGLNKKVGLFTSPHVSSFRERMQVNGELIAEQEVVEWLPKIYDACVQHDIPATFFEITTALAFCFYRARGCDYVVLETGLGGRLDATNVLSSPAISVITSIGLEHTRILGDTIELIAKEKGGIIKEGRPVVVGPHVPHDVLRQCAADKKAGAYYISDDVLGAPLPSEDISDYDVENSRIVRATLKVLQDEKILPPIPDEVVSNGVAQRPPCRFEIVETADGLSVVLDVAHNPPAMEYMVRKLKQTLPNDKFRVVVGMSSDKDLKQCGDFILGAVDGESSRIHLVQAAHPRAASLEAILEATNLQDSVYDFNDRSITRQIQRALNMAKESRETLVVCGSVFIMAEAREALGFDEPRDSDYIAEVAGAGVRHGQENFGNTKMEDEAKVAR